MALGPIEILVIEFPGNQFTGEIIPELERLIANDTISIIDGLLVRKDTNGDVTFVEFDELGVNDDAAKLAGVMDQLDSLISDEDVDEWADRLEPGNSEAILVFEHTWAKPLPRCRRRVRRCARRQHPHRRARWSTNCWPNSPNCPTTDRTLASTHESRSTLRTLRRQHD